MHIKNRQKLFEFVYAQAISRATNQAVYAGVSTKALLGKENPDEHIDSGRLAALAMHEVKSYVNALFDYDGFATQEAHDKAHEHITSRVIDIYSAYTPEPACDDASALKQAFTFGNAQQLVNMVATHYYFYTRDEPIGNVFRHCHCRMSSWPITVVAELIGALVDKSQRLDDNEAAELLEGYAHRRPRVRDWKELDTFSWGNMTADTRQPYDTFQRAVRFLGRDAQVTQEELMAPCPLSPLEFGLYVWHPYLSKPKPMHTYIVKRP